MKLPDRSSRPERDAARAPDFDSRTGDTIAWERLSKVAPNIRLRSTPGRASGQFRQVAVSDAARPVPGTVLRTRAREARSVDWEPQ